MLAGLVAAALCPGRSQARAAMQRPDTSQNIYINVKSDKKTSVYTSAERPEYKLDIRSTYRGAQDGKISYVIYSDFGQKLSENSISAHIGREGSNSYSIELPTQKSGVYQVQFIFSLTDYDDTIKRVFAVDPDRIKPNAHRPADFDAFWQKALGQLKATTPRYDVTEDTEKSTEDVKVYLVEMHSYGGAIIRGWLSIPTHHKPAKIPVKLRLPGYTVALTPTMDDQEFAIFNLNVRGSGNSRDAIKYDGEYNLWHLSNKDDYIYKSIIMDCVRGLDFITDNATKYGFDLKRVNADGGSQGAALAVILAGLDNRVKLVTAELPLYADLRDAIKIGPVLYPEKKSPVWMLQYYAKRIGVSQDRIFDTWDYYDPINFAPNVKCPVLVAISLLDELVPPRCSFALINTLGTPVKEYYVNSLLTHEVNGSYYKFQYYWVKEMLRLP